MIRFFDLLISITILITLFPLLLIILIIAWIETGSPIFSQQRIGFKQKPFYLLKFRTMQINTESVGTHLVDPSAITKLGYFLRKTKIDELPQIWNVIKGDMSFVGPRPCLFNQKELIYERQKRNIFNVKPGITGLAQINGINMSTPKLLADTDLKMLKSKGLKSYFYFIFMTILYSLKKEA